MNLEKSGVARSAMTKISSIPSNDGLDKSSLNDVFKSRSASIFKRGVTIWVNKRNATLSLIAEKFKIKMVDQVSSLFYLQDRTNPVLSLFNDISCLRIAHWYLP